MCMEDIRIGRQLWAKQLATAGATVAGTSLLTPSSLRVRIHWSFITDPVGNPGAYVLLVAGPDKSGSPVATLTVQNPNLSMRIEEWGSLVTGKWSVRASDDTGFQISAQPIELQAE